MIKVNENDLAQPMVFNGGLYTQVNVGDEVVWSLTPIHNQTKSLTVTANTTGMTITYDSGYTGLEEVDLVVNVPQSGGSINNQTKYVNYTGNTATTVTYDAGYTGLESVGIIVNVPEPEFSGLTATTNGDYTPSGFDGFSAVTVSVPEPVFSSLTATTNTTYTPSGFDGYSAVTVNVPMTAETTSETYTGQVYGMKTFQTPLSSVTFIADENYVVSDWSQVSAATSINQFSSYWNLINMRGYNANDDTFPYYSMASDKCPMVVGFTGQLPYASDLHGFLANHLDLYYLGINDAGLALADDSINFTEIAANCPALRNVDIRQIEYPITSGPKRCDFSRAFAGCTSLTNVLINYQIGTLQDNNYFRGTFSGCTSLQQVFFGGNMRVQSLEDTAGMFDGCNNLESVVGFEIISCPYMSNAANPFYNKPNLTSFYGIQYLGVEFTNNPGYTDHVFDLSASTGLTTLSLSNIIDLLGTVPPDVTDAQLILGPTNVAKLTSEQIIAVANKNWHLS